MLAIEAGALFATAAEQAGVSPVAALRWRAEPGFRQRFEAAYTPDGARLKREALRRAMGGSDRLLLALLAVYVPEEFGAVQESMEKVDYAALAAEARRRLIPDGAVGVDD